MVIEVKNVDINSYDRDQLHYESYPYYQSHLYLLSALGKLFEMDPTSPKNARILEMGCAMGGNLIPQALSFPESQFIGVDLSTIQIDEANRQKSLLGLKNIEFRNCSITEIDESYGKFDYIICHSVISWVPEFVRDKIFEVCNNNLNKNGIAYINYDTLPGGNILSTIRDMILYQTKGFNNIHDKIFQAKLLLKFIKDSLEGSELPYAEILKNEAILLSKKSENYIRHTYLEEQNFQYYFMDFIKEAQKYGLQYLTDVDLSSKYIGNMPQKVIDKLTTVDDIVFTEQYMDFINNRHFRSSLLCHKDLKLNRNIKVDDAIKFNLLFNLVPERALSEVRLDDPLENINFFLNGNYESKVSTSSPFMKAIMYTFAENELNPLSFDKIIKEANKKLIGNKIDEIKNEFLNNIINLILRGYVIITTQEERKKPNLQKPKTSKFVQHQLNNMNNSWVTNVRHEAIEVNVFEKFALKYMNGKNTKTNLLNSILKHAENNEFTLSKDGKKVEDLNEIHNELSNLLELAITKFASSGLIE